MKEILKKIGASIAGLITLLILLIVGSELYSLYLSNYKYSIAMPEIFGGFTISDDYVNVYGLEWNGASESLRITEVSCFVSKIPELNKCDEKRAVIAGIGKNYIFPYYKEYKIKYADKDKILFTDNIETSGEIDLSAKSLIYTIKSPRIEKGFEKVEIITDNNEIEKLEKRIIKKYLKRKMFK